MIPFVELLLRGYAEYLFVATTTISSILWKVGGFYTSRVSILIVAVHVLLRGIEPVATADHLQ
jgi:hypothetical protein